MHSFQDQNKKYPEKTLDSDRISSSSALVFVPSFARFVKYHAAVPTQEISIA